ncbi:MAG TPA: hypothetical protein VKR22_04830 [Acidimicrobiales bacterium]|nr:hypothetical protein [Acidimicrobiales bacterium]
MIRRFETYAFLPGTPEQMRKRLAEVLGHCHRYIPEVIHNAVGWNDTDSPSELVWEHAYESAEAYRRYMVHPYHADLIDRYVLPDAPERVVEPITGAGLFGYHCPEASFVLKPGEARRVVLLRFEKAGAERGRVEGRAVAFAGAASEAGKNAGAIMSVVGTNTLANTWFDGETPHGPPPRWSHIWEQGYGDLATLEEHGSSTGADFLHEQGVERFIELRYEVLEPD